MSVKYFDRVKNKWVIFPGTVGAPGKDAYIIAQENGYTGTKEEFVEALVEYPDTKKKVEELSEYLSTVDELPKKDSDNLVTSGGVYNSLKKLKNKVDSSISDLDKNLNEKFDNFKDGTDRELEDIHNKLSKAKKKITDIESDLNGANDKISSLEKDVEDNKKELSELDDNLSETNTKIEETNTKIEDLSQQITNTENKLSDLKDSVKELVVDDLDTEDPDKVLSARQGFL